MPHYNCTQHENSTVPWYRPNTGMLVSSVSVAMLKCDHALAPAARPRSTECSGAAGRLNRNVAPGP